MNTNVKIAFYQAVSVMIMIFVFFADICILDESECDAESSDWVE